MLNARATLQAPMVQRFVETTCAQSESPCPAAQTRDAQELREGAIFLIAFYRLRYDK